MSLTEFLNANISKKWGLALAAMYFVSQTENMVTAWQIVMVAVTSIVAQCVIDYKTPPV